MREGGAVGVERGLTKIAKMERAYELFSLLEAIPTSIWYCIYFTA